jgi:hypothetical protein
MDEEELAETALPLVDKLCAYMESVARKKISMCKKSPAE